MKLRFLGAARTVTGSFFVVETGQVRFAVDCGMFQGPRTLQERNYQEFTITPKTIDFVIATHAHIDHIGLIPKLCKHGFQGLIYSSHATEELAAILLPDSGYIQESEVERKNRKLNRAGKPLIEPIYTAEEALMCLKQFRSLNQDEIIDVAPGVQLRLRDAGHILGACIVELWIEEEGKRIKLVFSGDLGNFNQPIVKDPTTIENGDYIILESTYGSRLHPELVSRSDALLEVINKTMARGGNLVIPAFAVERTQDLLYDLFLLNIQGKLDPEITVFIDSPLAIAATEIFQKHIEFYDDVTRQYVEEHTQQHPLKLMNLKFTKTQEESMGINARQGKTIIISASGMCEAGRIKHHLKNNLWRSEATILFVGYQAEGTLGKRILSGEKVVTIHGEKVAVKASIEFIEAYSAHADKNGLTSWVKNFVTPPKGIFLVHGEDESLNALAEYFRTEMNLPVYIPQWLDEFTLGATEQLEAKMEYREGFLPEALKAEQAYLALSLKLHDMFKENWKEGSYDKIINTVQEIERQLKRPPA
ncbi:MAG: MBL fold metallo-hydrolase RNA specificity domain-containing protein [Syntrophomonadaceae bacterium]|jgi:metallo-beta-lactamase family protein